MEAAFHVQILQGSIFLCIKCDRLTNCDFIGRKVAWKWKL